VPSGPLPAPKPPRRPWRPRRRSLLLAAAACVVVLALIGGTVAIWGDGRSSSTSAPATSTAAPGTSAPGGGPTTSAPPASQTPAAVRAVESQVARLRGLDFLRAVPVTVESPAKVAARLLRASAGETDKAELARQARALEELGELPKGTDLYGLLRSVQAESVLGFYVPGKPPRRGRLYVRSDRGLDPYTRIVLSHELTHAVTDQHFDLTRADKLEAGEADDQATAYAGLVEGDATVLMQLYHDQALSPTDQASAARAGAAERSPKLDAAPAVVRESLLFPYSAGAAFVRGLYQRGGWDAVNRAYRDPPTSTEQLLHLDKYLGKRDVPEDVRVPDLRGSLGQGWRPGAQVEWGEFDTRLLLQGSFPVTTAERVAAGWDGGELRSFQRSNQTALVLRTVWDSPAEAAEYCTAMARWATVRLGAPVGTNRWSGSLQRGALVCSGTHAAWVSAPDRAALDGMVRGLGGA
jgi:hypothetical protein